MINWSGIDFFIFLVILVNTLLGMARGALKELISILCLCAALIFMIKFTLPLSNFINSSPLMSDVIASSMIQNFMISIDMGILTTSMLLKIGYSISLLICFVGIFCICEAMLFYANAIQVFSWTYSFVDRKLGAALGCIRGYVFVMIFVLLYLLICTPITNSYFVNLIQNSSIKLNQLILQQVPEHYQEILQNRKIDAKDVFDVLNNPNKTV